MTILTLIETAELLKVSPRTVRRLPIPRAYVGGQIRYDLLDLEAYVSSRKQGGQDRAPSRPAAKLVTKGDLAAQMTSLRIVQHRNPLYAVRTAVLDENHTHRDGCRRSLDLGLPVPRWAIPAGVRLQPHG